MIILREFFEGDSAMLILKAEMTDLVLILELQYLAYKSEAELLNDYTIQPLKETLEELEQEFRNGIILKAVNNEGYIIGSVRGHIEGNTLLVGKLMVNPEYQGKGIGTQLLTEIEKVCPQPRYELYTSDKSIKNIKLYEKMGYVKFQENDIFPDWRLVYLEKRIPVKR